MTSENRTHIPGVEQVYYDDCGHSILVDQPEALVRDVLEFIER